MAARPHVRRADPGAAIAWIALGVVAVALVATVAGLDYLPTNDGPQAIFAAHAKNHWGDPGTIYARQLEPASQFAYRGFAAIVGPIEAWLPWKAALRVAIAVVALAGLAGFAALARGAAGRAALAPLGVVVALSWQLPMGFFAFQVGTAIGLFVIAAARGSGPPSTRRRLALGAALLVQASAHVFTAALTGAVVAAMLVARARGRRLAELARVAAMGAPAGAVALLAARDQRGLAAVVAQGDLAWPSPGSWLATTPRFVLPGPAALGWIVIALAAAGAISTLARRPARAAAPDDAALAVSAIALMALGLFAPLEVPGWQFVSPRFLPLACAIGIALLPLEAIARARAAAVAVALIALGVCAVEGAAYRDLARACAGPIAALDAPIARRGMVLPVAIDPTCGAPEGGRPDLPHVVPFFHAGALFAAAHGGSTPYLFEGSPAVHAFVARRGSDVRVPVPDLAAQARLFASDAFARDPAVRGRALDELAAMGTRYESVALVGGREADHDAWIARGYAADHRGPGVLLARFVGCRVGVDLPADDARLGPTIEIGLAGQGEPTTALRVAPPRAGGDGGVGIDPGPEPCGPSWVRVLWDVDGSGGPSRGDRACEGADAEGKVAVTLGARPTRVACRPAPLGAVTPP